MKKIVPSLLLLLSLPVLADEKTFEEVWETVYRESPAQKAAMAEHELQQLGLGRASRHWLPKVYASAMWFSTNDPTQVFFNNLGQRSVQQSDFVPSTLNTPGRSSYKAGVVGVDLPLYEGGMKAAEKGMYEKLVKASELEQKAKRSEEFSDLALHYGNFYLHTLHRDLLIKIQQEVSGLINNYQVGKESNPVGYSGLLGLKGVLNRIDGLLVQTELKKTMDQQWMEQRLKMNSGFTPVVKGGVQGFIHEHLSSSSRVSYSTQILAGEMKLQTFENVRSMENSRFLPRIGLFAQNNLYNGSRDTASSQTYGLYLRWELFSPDSYGRLDEVAAKKRLEESKLSTYKQEEITHLRQLMSSQEALGESLKILDKSDGLLREQMTAAMKLFRSGMLSALQLSEVINRRVDLLENRQEISLQSLTVAAKLYQLNN